MFAFTIDDLLRNSAETRPEAICLIHNDQELTYAELERQVDRLAAWLMHNGLGRGDRIAIHLPGCVDEVVATFAVARVGAVFVNVHRQRTASQLAYILGDAGARALITWPGRARELSLRAELSSLRHLEHVLVTGNLPGSVPGHVPFSVPGSVIDTDLAAIMYTSGSSGPPKGVMLTHRNLVAGARSVASYLSNTADDRLLGLLPLCFDYGLNQLLSMVLVGGSLVIHTVAIAHEIAQVIERHGVTGMAAVPPVWIPLTRYLLDYPRQLSSLRYITNSGGAIPMSILQSLSRAFPDTDIVLMYGLTEAFRSTYLPPERFAEKMGSMGIAIPNAEIFVVDAEGGLCGPGQQGELLHRGSLVAAGYWQRPEASAAKFKPSRHLRHLIGDEPVVHSGDIVRIDGDGYLWYVGRRDGLIKCSGFRVSPDEVESIAHESGLVAEVVAFGAPDDLLGQVVHLAAVLREDRGAGLADLAAHCRSALAPYMNPRRIWPWSGTMPRTASGKIDRQAVIAECMSQLAGLEGDRFAGAVDSRREERAA